jgi:hypothetical protein
VDQVKKKKGPRSGPFTQVRAIGVEPTWIAPADPKSAASANFATPANDHLNIPIELPANFRQFFLSGHQIYTALNRNVLSSNRRFT